LLLVTRDFLEHAPYDESEMEQALARHKAGRGLVVPIIIDSCDWESRSFGQLHALPKSDKPLALWRNQSEAWASVVRGVQAAAGLLARFHPACGGVDGRPRPIPPLDPNALAIALTKSGDHRRTHPSFILQLRDPTDVLIGRDREHLDVLRNLGPMGAFISGKGGIGKTMLARHLAQELVPHFPDGQIEIDLRGSYREPLSPAAALRQLLAALYERSHGIRATHLKLPASEEGLAAQLRSELQHKRMLLLLDDMRDGDQLKRLLPPPQCLLLVTSRQRLSGAGVYAACIDALDPGGALALVRSMVPRLDEAAGSEVAQLCGYQPVALRFAASTLAADLNTTDCIARMRAAHHIEDPVAARLDERLACLDSPLRELWLSLSVFSGHFDREAAASVGAVGAEAIATGLRRLQECSLIEHDVALDRYYMHKLAWDHARSLLEGRGRYDAERRHAEHIRNWLYLKHDSPARMFKMGDRERTEIETALSWAAAHSTEDDAAATICCDILLACGYLLADESDSTRYEGWSSARLSAVRRLGRSEVATVEGPASFELSERTLAIARERGDRHTQANTLCALANKYASSGDSRRAADFFEQLLNFARESGDRNWEATALERLGTHYTILGDTQRAIESSLEAISAARDVADRTAESRAAHTLVGNFIKLGDRRAIEVCEQYINNARRPGDDVHEGMGLDLLAGACVALGETERGIQIYEQRLALARSRGDAAGEGAILDRLGTAYVALGAPARAIELHEKAVALSRGGHKRYRAATEASRLWNLGLAYEAVEDLVRAIAAMQACVDSMRTRGLADEAERREARVNELRARLEARGGGFPQVS